MTILDQIRRKRQRMTEPEVHWPIAQVEVVDVEADPEPAGLPVVPPATEQVGEEVPSPPRTKVGTKGGGGKGKVPMSLGGPPGCISRDPRGGRG